jgi:phytoene synthase
MIGRRQSQPAPNPFGQIMRRHARTFTFAASFLDQDRRRATEVLYAFFRILDDLIDERPADVDIAQLHGELARWDALVADPERARSDESPLARALADVMLRYKIPPAYLQSLLRGLADDLNGRPIAAFDDLERYCFRVASSVGLAMCHVLGATTPSALMAASAVGIAMQLTNILRDVDADLARGRVYLPSDEITRLPGAMESLCTRRSSPALRELLRLQISRARQYYAAGTTGVSELPPRVRFPILVAIELYSEILVQLERQHLDVFAGRAMVRRRRKLVLAGRAAFRQLVLAGRAAFRQLARPAGGSGTVLATLGPAAVAELVSVGVPIPVLRTANSTQPALVRV